FSKRILTTFPETMNYLPVKKTTNVGAVVRKELLEGSQEKGYQFTKLNEKKPVILIMGGSGGSRIINETIRKNLSTLLINYQIKYIYAITDYIISRAGSNAIFEFLALNIPMLLIPLTHGASRGDQIVNARSFEKQGYAQVLEEDKLSGENLLKSIDDLVLN